MNTFIQDFNSFLTSIANEKEFRFKDGFYLKVKKHIKNGLQFLEIHTSGYDDTLKIADAIEWIKWTVLDYQANGIM